MNDSSPYATMAAVVLLSGFLLVIMSALIEHRQEVRDLKLQHDLERIVEENEELRRQNNKLRDTLLEMTEHLETLKDLDELMGPIEELQELEIIEGTITNYAPLDPNAIEGMCFEGDPNITASGATVRVGRTAAADPRFPFGTRIWVEGYGWRVVEDRGGAITGNTFDIAIYDKQTAYARGPHERIVIVDWRDE